MTINGYVLQRFPQGDFVAMKGNPASYTTRLQVAQIFQTYEEAEGASCPGNERPVSLAALLKGRPA